MRKLLFGAFLLGTTALFPVQAHAMPPVLGFLGGIVTSLGATGLGGAIVGLGGAGALGGFAAGYGFAGSLLGGALINIGLSLGLSYLASLLQPRPSAPNPGAKMVNARQPISYFDFVYGNSIRKGGPVAFWQAKDGKRFYDVMLAAHKIGGFVGRFLDENDVSLDGSGFVQEASYDYKGPRVQVVEYDGTPGQGAPALLTGNFTQWTSAYDMEGIAHAVIVAENVKAEEFSRIYPSGREPVYTALIDGKPVFDPRDNTQTLGTSSTYKTTGNAALIIADWITSSDGLGRDVDWDKVADEADICDIDVLDRNGNTTKKWLLAGSFTSNDDRETVRANLGVACDAFFYEDTDGTVGFSVGRYIAPAVTIADEDIIGVRYSEGQAGTDVANAQVVEYTEPDMGYREAAAAPYAIDVSDEAYTENSLSVFWIPNHNQAVRVEKRLLLASRAKYKASMSLKYGGARLIGQRFFRLRHDEFGVDMTFEVDKLSRGDDAITWLVEAHSVLQSDFYFDASTEEPAKPSRIDLELSDDIADPTNVVLAIEQVSGTVAIAVSFDALPRDSLLAQVRYRVSPSGDWTTLSVPAEQNHQNIVGVVDGETYDVQVRALTSTGKSSKWTPRNGDEEDDPTLTITVIADTVAPQALLTVSATGGAGEFQVNFGTQNDAHLASVAVYRVASGGTLNRATDLSTRPAVAPGISYSIPVTSPAGSWDIYTEPMNRSSIAGPLVGPKAVTVT